MNISIFSKTGDANDYDVTAGLHGQLSREEYDAIPALSSTVLKKWLVLSSTPTEFAWWLKQRWLDITSTSALSMGSALDLLVLDYENAAKRMVVFTPAGPKKITQSHRDAHPGKIVLSHEEFSNAMAMAKALNESQHTSFGEDFVNCSKQIAIAEVFGVPFKCEFDMWTPETENICDIKTARDVTPVEFGKAFTNFGYDMQASLYLAIARALDFDKRVFNFVSREERRAAYRQGLPVSSLRE